MTSGFVVQPNFQSVIIEPFVKFTNTSSTFIFLSWILERACINVLKKISCFTNIIYQLCSEFGLFNCIVCKLF
ncbi:hypothetical protein A6767_01865 [Aeromonas veronii]|nr:hypothetical protein A6767_01865 [Aeromonas veronii]